MNNDTNNEMIEEFIKELEANNRSVHTILAYKQVLTKLDTFKPLDKIKKADLVDFFKNFDGADSSRELYQTTIKSLS